MYFNIKPDKPEDTILCRIKKITIISLFALPLALFIYYFLLGKISDSSTKIIISLIAVASPISIFRVYLKIKERSKLVVEVKDLPALATGSCFIDSMNDWFLSGIDLTDKLDTWGRVIRLNRRDCRPMKFASEEVSLDDASFSNEDLTPVFSAIP